MHAARRGSLFQYLAFHEIELPNKVELRHNIDASTLRKLRRSRTRYRNSMVVAAHHIVKRSCGHCLEVYGCFNDIAILLDLGVESHPNLVSSVLLWSIVVRDAFLLRALVPKLVRTRS